MSDHGTILREINLRDLTRRYRDQTCAADALPLLASLSDTELDHLLRDHRMEPIRDALEIQRRDAVDDLLTFYGRIEIASRVGFVPDPLPEDFRQAAAAYLSNPAVERWYTDFYPLKLPGLLMRRLAGDPVASGIERPAGNALFLEFMDTVSLIEGDPDVDRFLWFLDDGWSNGRSLKDVLAVLGDADGFLAALVEPDEDVNAPDPVTQGVRGLREYLLFCSGFDALLQRSAPYPVLQAALWHDQAYWFINLRDKVGATLLQAVDAIAAWGADEAAGSEGLPELRGAIARLLSGEYGRALQDAAPMGARATGRGVSIHIGVDFPTEMSLMPFSHNEENAWKMAELATQAGYQAVSVLRGREATRETVARVLASTIRDLKPGDTLFVSFSGPGFRMADLDEDEKSKWDESWCLYDDNLLDDELTELWKLLAPGTRALVINESLRSSGVARGEATVWPEAEADPEYRSAGDVSRGLVPSSPTAYGEEIQASLLVLSAESNGLYTQHLLEAWNHGEFRGSFLDLHRFAYSRMQTYGIPQEPRIFMLGAANPSFPDEVAFHLGRR